MTRFRWDATSPFFVEYDRKPKKKKRVVADDDEEETNTILNSRINELIIGEWEG